MNIYVKKIEYIYKISILKEYSSKQQIYGNIYIILYIQEGIHIKNLEKRKR